MERTDTVTEVKWGVTVTDTVTRVKWGVTRSIRRGCLETAVGEVIVDAMAQEAARFHIEWHLFVIKCEEALPALKADWFIETLSEIRVKPIFQLTNGKPSLRRAIGGKE